MPGRSRSSNINRESGRMGFFSTQPFDTTLDDCLGGFGSCDDVIGSGDCAPFRVERFETEGAVLHLPSGNSAWFNYYVTDAIRNMAFGSHLSPAGIPTSGSVATAAAARTNPSAPYVDVPINMLDMRHVLENIKHAGDQLITNRRIHEANLEYQFLYAPLVGDIVKAMNATDQINRRIAEIHQLYNGRGIRKTVGFGVYSDTQVFPVIFQSLGFLTGNYVTVSTATEVKCHCRWRPAHEVPLEPGPLDARLLAIRSTFGLTLDFSTVWNVIPWTWLIDWFSNVSQYLIAERNIIPAILTDVCPMYHTRTLSTWDGYPLTGLPGFFSGGKAIRESKSRLIGAVAPEAQLNFLNETQMGILASILSTRR